MNGGRAESDGDIACGADLHGDRGFRGAELRGSDAELVAANGKIGEAEVAGSVGGGVALDGEFRSLYVHARGRDARAGGILHDAGETAAEFLGEKRNCDECEKNE